MVDFSSQEAMDKLVAVRDKLIGDFEKSEGAAEMAAEFGKNQEAIYSLAHSAYSVENYAEAETLFMGMVLFDASDVRGWLGYAGASEAQKKWAQAIEGYAAVMHLAPDDPVAPYRAGICLMALDMRDNARAAFETALGTKEKVLNNVALLPYVQRAESMLRLLEAD